MGTSQRSLVKTYEGVINSQPVFPLTRLAHRFNRAARKWLGVEPNWAIDRDVLLDKLREILPQGHMTAMNAAAFICASLTEHKHSHHDPVNFLYNFLKLYNAKSVQEACDIEEIAPGSGDFFGMCNAFFGLDDPEQRLEAIKIYCWGRDSEAATKGSIMGRYRGIHKPITLREVQEIASLYQAPRKDSKHELLESDGKETLSAFPKDEFLPLLREQRRKGVLSETQCGILLCFILHSRETRNDGSSYVTHPVAVADLVRQHGEKYLHHHKGKVWMACLAALLHDGGEKSNIDLDKDLDGLLPIEVIEAVKCLHKKDDETYFEYIERCAANPLAAVVKLCDLYHNSLDANKKPSFKQEYTYPIAADYILHRLTYTQDKIAVADFCDRYGVCDNAIFQQISTLTANNKKIDVAVVRDTLGPLKNLLQIKDIFTRSNANTRREEDPALHI